MQGYIIIANIIIVHIMEQTSAQICYGCSDSESCLSPRNITCNACNANETLNFLRNTFSVNVVNVTNDDFVCMYLKKPMSNQAVIEYAGCIFKNVQPCLLKTKPIYEDNIPCGLETKTDINTSPCYTCLNDLCNRIVAADISSRISFNEICFGLLIILIILIIFFLIKTKVIVIRRYNSVDEHPLTFNQTSLISI